MTTRIALVDDHAMVVEGLAAALSTFTELEIVGRGGTTSEARELLERDDLDVVLLDVRLEDGNGLQVLAERPARERPKVLVISSFKSSQYIAAATRFGASGFLLKSVPLRALQSHPGDRVGRDRLQRGAAREPIRNLDAARAGSSPLRDGRAFKQGDRREARSPSQDGRGASV
jgi:DNA-binding NtrC family response regulator